jgi:hypothetical protein
MRHAYARNHGPHEAEHSVTLSVLDAAAHRVTRRRAQEAWFAAVMVALILTFGATLVWYVFYPAMRTLVGP